MRRRNIRDFNVPSKKKAKEMNFVFLERGSDIWWKAEGGNPYLVEIWFLL